MSKKLFSETTEHPISMRRLGIFKDQSYESRQNLAFDWRAFLKQPFISVGEWEDAEALAGNWVTCACGNQCDIIPRQFPTGAPIDSQLAILGIKFQDAIKAGHSNHALQILDQIEARSIYLIQIIEDFNAQPKILRGN